MQQHLGRQAGVQKVEVSLVDGKVVIFRKEDSKFDPSAIFKAVYDSGVSVSEMAIIASGEIVKDGATGMIFKIGDNLSFPVKPNAISKVEVSLVDGKVVIFRKEDSKFDPSAIFKAVYDSGVSVSEMAIIASGEIVKDGH